MTESNLAALIRGVCHDVGKMAAWCRNPRNAYWATDISAAPHRPACRGRMPRGARGASVGWRSVDPEKRIGSIPAVRPGRWQNRIC